MPDNVHAILRDRLRKALSEAPGGLSRVSATSGYSKGYIAALAGRSVRQQNNPTIGAVWAIAGALGVDPFWLLGK